MIGHKAILFVPIKPNRRSLDDEDQEELGWGSENAMGFVKSIRQKEDTIMGRNAFFVMCF